MAPKYRVVWVLGAGFSRPLGGPLLTDMFTKTSFETALLRFDRNEFPELHGPAVLAACWLYQWGSGFPEGPKYTTDGQGQRLWNDAEEFLDKLDTASRLKPGTPNWERLARPIAGARPLKSPSPDLKEIVVGARRLLAAECSGFLLDADLDEERWQPYRQWARDVANNDAIITFNYDLVLERLAYGPDVSQVQFETFFPNQLRKPGIAPVLKLHGSVDWKRADDPKRNAKHYSKAGNDHHALICPGDEIAIASPGPTKLSRARELEHLWSLAEEALSNAGAVVFLGYRFPPTDSEARRRLLGALSENKQPYLAAHTVLGPSSPDSDRLTKMLMHSIRGRDRTKLQSGATPDPSHHRREYSLIQHPLYGQDFFTVVNPGAVINPYDWGLS